MSINVSNKALNLLKQSSETLGALNTANKFLMELFDPQFKNIFEIILYPASITASLTLEGLTGVGTAILDTTITRLHLQSITLAFKDLEYGDADITKFVKGLVRPTEVTLNLIENELGVVRNYLQYWLNEIIVEDPVFGYRFRDNQLASKKNAMIIPQMGTSLPSTAWVKLEGLKYKSQASQTFGHGETEPMIMEVTCSIDNVQWQTLIGAIT